MKKAKEDKTFKTDMAEEEFMSNSSYNDDSLCILCRRFLFGGSKENEDYTPELIKLKRK